MLQKFLRTIILPIGLGLAALPILLGELLPPAVYWTTGALAILLVLLFIIDIRLTRWLQRNAGGGLSPLQFILDEKSPLLLGAGLTIALSAFFGWLEFQSHEFGLQPLLLLSLFGLMISFGVVSTQFVRIIFRKAPPVKLSIPSSSLEALNHRLQQRPLREQIQEAWDFDRICGTRVARSLLLLIIAAGGLSIVVTGIGAGLLAIFTGGNMRWDIFDTPVYIQLVWAFVFGMNSWILTTTMLGAFRIVQRVRRVGRIAEHRAWREVGFALETVGVIPSMAWGIGVIIGILVLITGGFFTGQALLSMGLSSAIAIPLTSIGFVVLGWLLLLWPQMYVLPVMTRRDCGWIRAFEVSLEIVILEGRASLIKALIATGWVLTIVGIPAAIHLLLSSLDHRELLLSAILNEKSDREIKEALQTAESNHPIALRKYYDLLEKGRYLDALNGFQLFLRSNRENVDGLRGEALALLHMGNLKAREVLERWERLDETSDEATVLLAEFNQGLWRDGGARLEDAKKRCTQQIGRGI